MKLFASSSMQKHKQRFWFANIAKAKCGAIETIRRDTGTTVNKLIHYCIKRIFTNYLEGEAYEGVVQFFQEAKKVESKCTFKKLEEGNV